eukprot:SAG31_NODE_11297_length_1044_cov_1.610582_3_plen_34_part_01
MVASRRKEAILKAQESSLKLASPQQVVKKEFDND